MPLTRQEVLAALLEALTQAQLDVTHEPEPIDEATRPIGDLLQFDSLTSVVVTLHCFTTLGIEHMPSIPSIFIDKQNRSLTVSEVVDRILTLQKIQLERRLKICKMKHRKSAS
jgi:hypothetical protein